MKKLVFLIVFFNNISFSQENYFPLEVGNYWQFKGTYSFSTQNPVVFYDYMKVLGEIELGTPIRSFKLVKSFMFAPYYIDTYQFLTYDSITNSIIEYSVLEDTSRILFDLNAEPFECWYAAAQMCYQGLDTIQYFGDTRISKAYIGGLIPSFSYQLTLGLGPTSIVNNQSYGILNITAYELVYAKINGVEYGQLVSVSGEHPESPTEFYLSQNYPNPFNPSTKISWQSPVGSLPDGKAGWQTLKVYDVLGNEVATLVDEEKSVGSYEVEFNGVELTSGIYFYRLQAGDPSSSSGQVYVETKKMILLK